jgi:hypothetical protein
MGLFSRKKDQVPQVIDLREPEPVPRKPQWGSPVPCPECSGRGYLDHIDPYREVMFLHCTQCYAKYQVARADIDVDQPADAFTI